MLRNLGIDKVDYLKFDIEGAEREALKGAADLLRRSKPRLMLDAYHKPDDLAVLPALIQGANRTYRQVCGVCTLQIGESGNQVIPYVVFFE
jgi:phosphoenolpyruvate synthase/pyruvate phosphate dikinase